MAGIDASIPLGVKVPDMVSTIGSIANAQRSMQQVQLGNVELQKNEIALKERKGIQDLFKNAESFKNPDGQFDYNRLIEEGMKVAPTTFPSMVPQIIQARKLGVEAERSFSELNESTRAGAAQWFMGQKDKPLEQVAVEAEGIKKLNPALAPAIDNSLKVLAFAAKGGQEALNTAYLKLGQQAMPPAQQAAAITPNGPGFNTGAVSGQINTNPMAGPTGPIPGTVTENVVPPAQAESVGTDQAGNPIRVVKGPNGVLRFEPMNTGAPGAPAPQGGAPRAQPMYSFPPGESKQSAEALAQERQASLGALNAAPMQHTTNRGVLEEIDKVAATGTLGPRTQALMSAAGVTLPKGWGGSSSEEKASAYDLVGKYLERNALEAAKGMGPHTNAGLESQIKAQGSVAYNPTAIKKITKLNDAIVTGTEWYQPGLEKAITSSPDQIFAKRQFDQAWAQNFDPRVMQLYNAQKAGDTSEVNDLLKTLGGRDSAGAKELARKAKNLEMLSTQGRL